MKRFIPFLLLLFSYAFAAAQSYRRATTTSLKEYVSIKQDELDETSNIRWALPLIDSSMALELALAAPGISCDGTHPPENGLAAKVAIQLRNEKLRQKILEDMKAYHCRCADSSGREGVTKSDDKGYYTYDAATQSAFNNQVDEHDPAILQLAITEFEFWAPFAKEFMSTINKPGMHQLGINKQKFDPCVFAGYENAAFWHNYIYNADSRKTLGSAKPEANDVYAKMLKGRFRASEQPKFREPFRKLNEGGIMLTGRYETLEQLDFEKETVLKSLLDEVRGKEDWNIIIYTNGGKGLLYRSFLTRIPAQTSYQYAKFEQSFLVELEGYSQLKLTRIRLLDRYL